MQQDPTYPVAFALAASVTPATVRDGLLCFAFGWAENMVQAGVSWIDSGLIDAEDQRLLNSPLGLNRHRCLATLLFASGDAITRARREQLLELARDLIDPHELQPSAAATAPNSKLVVLRVLAAQVEPALDLLRQVRSAWRQALWQLPGFSPRVWMV